MARGKDPAPKPKPKPGRSDRKVIIEYSSDEEEPQQGGAPSKQEGEEADSSDAAYLSHTRDDH